MARMPSTIPDFEFDTITPRLLAGRNPLTADDVAQLRERGVTHILDLREAREWAGPGRLGSEAVEAIPRAGIERLNLPIGDMTAPAAEDFDRACAFLERALEEPESVVFVHCRAGQQRTGAILAAHVARQQGRGV
jgi:rhodanese-related sulfurtransferase